MADNTQNSSGQGRDNRDNNRGEGRRNNQREEREQSEFVDKLVGVRRVAKTVKGGRRMSFGALVVVGDEAGRVGFGQGKAKEVPDAVRKATDEAKRTMVRVPLRQGRTLHHDVKGTFGATRVIIKPAVPGTGIIAGGPMRAIFEAMGIKDIVAKAMGSTNPFNLIRATFAAFAAIETPRSIATKRGIKITDLALHATEASKGVTDQKEMLENAAKVQKAKRAAPAGRDAGRTGNRGPRKDGDNAGGRPSGNREGGRDGGRNAGPRRDAPKVVTVTKAESMTAATAPAAPATETPTE